jgi:drug/metabolite transporter (DMT)-like permease
MKNQNKAYFLAILAVLLWSTVATAFKFALKSYDFYQFLFISSGTALLFLFIVLLFQKKLKLLNTISKKDIPKLFFGGLINPFLYYLVLFKAYSLLPAQMAQSLNYTWPIMLVIFSTIFFKQKLKFKTIVSFVLGFVGVVIISFRGNLNLPEEISLLGVILATGSSILWASYWIINSLNKIDAIVGLFFNFLFGFIFIIPVLFIFSSFPSFEIKSFSAAVYSGLFEMGVTFLVWMFALKFSSSAAKISNLIFIAPFISLFLISIFLKEDIFISTIIGLLIIILGILIDKISFKK